MHCGTTQKKASVVLAFFTLTIYEWKSMGLSNIQVQETVNDF